MTYMLVGPPLIIDYHGMQFVMGSIEKMLAEELQCLYELNNASPT